MGTPAYMAPEQVLGSDAGAAADIFALGVVAFEMVTGELPFAAETTLATALKRLFELRPEGTFVALGAQRCLASKS